MTLKESLFKSCLNFIDERLHTIQKLLDEHQEALLSETKSSAGDKHETGRAMLQLQREKSGNQLVENLKTKAALLHINPQKSSNVVCLGSIVITDQANYFIAISVGALLHEKKDYFAISPHTPIGQLLLSKKSGDMIKFRDQEFKIIEVL